LKDFFTERKVREERIFEREKIFQKQKKSVFFMKLMELFLSMKKYFLA